ncbi:DUF6304 family protein [Streptomyces sp. NPDC093568]|uniref:DUF6304 family protein n=1 Tax=Streptomyces sp. NPDC093568 TaxID=3366041 RepID=UPI00381ED0C1
MTVSARWPGRYTDRHGSEEIVFESDGREVIRTTIRGVRFEGDTMDTLGALTGDRPSRRSPSPGETSGPACWSGS